MAIEDITGERLRELRDKCKYLEQDLTDLITSKSSQDSYSDRFASKNAVQVSSEDRLLHPSVFYCYHDFNKFVEIRVNKRSNLYYIVSRGFSNPDFLTDFFRSFKGSADIDCSELKIGPFEVLEYAQDCFNAFLRTWFTGNYMIQNELEIY